MHQWRGRTFAGLLLMLLWVWSVPIMAQPQQSGSCIACHLALSDPRLAEPAKRFQEDVHAVQGFGCDACHGGDPNVAGPAAMDAATGYLGVPARQAIPQVCGRCHSDATFMRHYAPRMRTDQVSRYYTSVHGQRLKDAHDPKVATCTSCHTVHAIKPASDPASSVHPLRVAQTCGGCHADAKYMQPYTLPTNQLAQYTHSVHWRALSEQGLLSAPTCNDCHGSHGAVPPGVSDIQHVCRQCHPTTAELFEKSKHADVFAQLGTPGCASCHGRHAIQEASDALLGLGDQAVCAQCHSAADPGGKVATQMQELIGSLQRAHDDAEAILRQAGRAGMAVSQAQFELHKAQSALIKARTAVHTFRVAAVRQEVEPARAIAAKAHARGVHALKELRFRHTGLGVSAVIILAVIIGLVLKIRQREHQPENPPGGGTGAQEP
jgi:predicted CXXCH cytochrome family protein